MARPAVSKGSCMQVIFIIIGFEVVLDVLVFLNKLHAALLVVNSCKGANLVLAGAVQASSISEWLIFRVA